jgi:hypothetical protein
MKNKVISPSSTMRDTGHSKACTIKEQQAKLAKQPSNNKNSVDRDQLVKYFTDLKKKPK